MQQNKNPSTLDTNASQAMYLGIQQHDNADQIQKRRPQSKIKKVTQSLIKGINNEKSITQTGPSFKVFIFQPIKRREVLYPSLGVSSNCLK